MPAVGSELLERQSEHCVEPAAYEVPNGFVGHGRQEKSKPRPSKPERVGHPEKQNQFLSIDVLEWYHAVVRARQAEKRRRVGHPPIFPARNGLPVLEVD